MTAPLPITVDPEAAVVLLELAARELRHARELPGPGALPYSVLFLTGSLEWACEHGVTPFAVEFARNSAYWARRCELAEAFPRLNSGFGRIHDGCWPSSLAVGDVDRACQHQAQRREAELALGARAAATLLAEGGGAE